MTCARCATYRTLQKCICCQVTSRNVRFSCDKQFQRFQITTSTTFRVLFASYFCLFFFFLVFNGFTCTCLQSCPRAGSWIRRNVIGHLRDTLMAVCSTPSSPFSVAFPEDAATLLKFLFTAQTGRGNQQAEEERIEAESTDGY